MMRSLKVGGHAVAIAEEGAGQPLLYLHGFADIHSSSTDFLPFHHELAGKLRVLAPAHPGCHASEENEEVDTIEDVAFHYLQVLDALGIDRFHLAGASIGGWIAAEIAIQIPERVRSLRPDRCDGPLRAASSRLPIFLCSYRRKTVATSATIGVRCFATRPRPRHSPCSPMAACRPNASCCATACSDLPPVSALRHRICTIANCASDCRGSSDPRW